MKTAQAPLAAENCPVGIGLVRSARPQDPSERYLSDILPPVGKPACGFTDLTALRDSVAAGMDPLLYQAWRDILPPRCENRTLPDGEDPEYWHADLVVYQPGVLADRQPTRSTGHWNSPDQLEIFQTLTGTTLILIALPAPGGYTAAGYQLCHPGDIAVIPFGAWHVTWCLDGPAAVFNIYTGNEHQAPAATSSGRAGKYHRDPGPGITAVTTSTGWQVISTTSAQPVSGPPPSAAQLLPAGTDLARLYRDASGTELSAVLGHARRCYGTPDLKTSGTTRGNVIAGPPAITRTPSP
ncbi:MAG TPA: hypothetical protein VNF47_18720 [Streptosporangiaceae bacterium]|nr:hypothetical protein [Streptosporangiaceae bacterium]